MSILCSDAGLAEQLRARLEHALGRAVRVLKGLCESNPHEVVITTTSACSPDECAGLSQSGNAVVVLAALPSSFQEQHYRKAGAAHYLAMSLDIAPLAAAVLSLI